MIGAFLGSFCPSGQHIKSCDLQDLAQVFTWTPLSSQPSYFLPGLGTGTAYGGMRLYGPCGRGVKSLSQQAATGIKLPSSLFDTPFKLSQNVINISTGKGIRFLFI